MPSSAGNSEADFAGIGSATPVKETCSPDCAEQMRMPFAPARNGRAFSSARRPFDAVLANELRALSMSVPVLIILGALQRAPGMNTVTRPAPDTMSPAKPRLAMQASTTVAAV